MMRYDDDDDLTPVYFNFKDYGPDGWWPVSKLEMKVMCDGVNKLIAENRDAAVVLMMLGLKARLLKEYRQRGVDEDWVSNAVMLAAFEGIHLGKLPTVRFINDKY